MIIFTILNLIIAKNKYNHFAFVMPCKTRLGPFKLLLCFLY